MKSLIRDTVPGAFAFKDDCFFVQIYLDAAEFAESSRRSDLETLLDAVLATRFHGEFRDFLTKVILPELGKLVKEDGGKYLGTHDAAVVFNTKRAGEAYNGHTLLPVVSYWVGAAKPLAIVLDGDNLWPLN